MTAGSVLWSRGPLKRSCTRVSSLLPYVVRLQSARPPPSLLHRGANMQNQPATRHAKLSEGACAAENAESLKCIEKNYTDKGKCAAHFRVYKACKAKAYEAARAARIKAHSGG